MEIYYIEIKIIMKIDASDKLKVHTLKVYCILSY